MTMPVFLYDGDCAFCTKCAQFLQRHVRTTAKIKPWQDTDINALGLSEHDVEAAVQWVEPGLTKAGPDAIAVLLRRAQWWWKPIGWAMSNRVSSALAWLLYRLVARHRDRMPGSTSACALPRPE